MYSEKAKFYVFVESNGSKEHYFDEMNMKMKGGEKSSGL